ncbi:NACHT domain-containing protein [Streptomyces sp. CA-106131]|uniref:NACHT domain-containing protein n=1 Tax=Streptomyces sp. CA-106131 TaxID=3240045 RepID=UPI003D8EB5F6
MSQVIRHPEGKYRAPNESLPLRGKRLLSQVKMYGRRRRMVRIQRRVGRRVALARRWRLRRTPATYLRIGAFVGAVALLAWIGLALSVIVGGGPGIVERTCADKSPSCSAVISFTTPFLALALSAATFLILQHFTTIRRVRRIAKKNPRDLVPTAGTILDKVVGREELCAVLAQSLRNRRRRRPYVIIGGVGSGKTAVLVQLTQLLAEKGALPVPIHLRRADLDNGNLNFSELAKKRFSDLVDPGVISRSQSERVWRQLCMDDKAVVIADGLEEAFCDDADQADRDGVIRRAIERASQQGLPLVIASRPHTALEGTQAAVIDLEPLSDEAALTYLAQQGSGADDRRLDWIVETAAVAESPLYLQIARQLRQCQLLDHDEGAEKENQIDTRAHDRSGIRASLLDTWVKALVDGHLRAQFGIPPEQRRKTISVISALACVGLLKDRLEVNFSELIEWSERNSVAELPQVASKACWRTNLSRFAAFGEQLGLVEAYNHKVRFPHSILQAYLGSTFLDAVQQASDGALETALRDPGRELLIALIMRSRRAPDAPQKDTIKLLTDAANCRRDDKALDPMPRSVS